MRVMTLNANGLRSAAKKGFFDWFATQDVDVLCLQEVRAATQELPADPFHPVGYHCYYHEAVRKGYSGVAVYTRRLPDHVETGLGFPTCDTEGRWISARFGALTIISAYFPSGTSGPERQAIKFDFLERLRAPLAALQSSGQPCLLCGDVNIAHKAIDLKNWRANQKASGFLPEERAWMDHLLGPSGWVDVFRQLYPTTEEYTWWSHWGNAWARNTGWRIDYHIATPELAVTARIAQIAREQRFSDHAPMTVEYAYAF